MSSLDQAVQTQLNNIQKKTGKKLTELAALIQKSGLQKHAELRQMLMRELGLGFGDANALVHAVLHSDGQRLAAGKDQADVLDELYSGARAALRPIHAAVMQEIARFGAFELAPKKGYISLRRKKQFAMLGPATNTRIELGLNHKGLPGAERLLEQPIGSMCNYIIKLTDIRQVDPELIAWLRAAYEAAG